MNLFALSGLLVFVSSLSFAIFSWVKGKKLLNKIWAFFNLSVAIWGLGAFKFATALNKNDVFFWLRIGHIGVILIPAFFLHFVFELLEIKTKRIIVFVYTVSILFFLVNFADWIGFTNIFIVNLRYVFNSFYVDSPPGLVYPLFVFFFFLVVIYAHYYGIKALKNSKGLKRLQIQYFLLATALGFGGGGTAFPMVFKIDIYPLLHFTVFFYPIIMTYAIFKYQLMDINVAITRAGIFTFVYALVLGIPFIIGHKYGLWKDATWITLILATTGPFIYNYLRQRAENILLKEQRRYQQTLLRASEGMTLIKELDKLLKLMVHILTKTIRLEYAAIYIYDKNTSTFQLKVKRGNSFDGHITVEPRNPLMAFILYHKKAITLETIYEFTADKAKYNPDDLKAEMKSLSASVIVPSVVENHLLAFLVLGEKISHRSYTEDDLNTFSILANHASLAIENALFYEEAGKTMAEKFHEHRLWSIGRMGSGVGHQINNRFNVISVRADAARLIEIEKLKKLNLSGEYKKLVSSLEETFLSLQQEAIRGGEIATTLTTFSRKTSDHTGIEFEAIVKGALNLLSCKFNIVELGVVHNYKKYPQKICGNLSQLQDVFVNLLDNAHDALNTKQQDIEAGNLKISQPFSPKLEINAQPEDKVWNIQLSDNGIGMKEEEQKQLFVPFFTTKATSNKGTGLGLSIIKQIIEAHNGTIEVESTYGKGTTFKITLPIATEDQLNPEDVIKS